MKKITLMLLVSLCFASGCIITCCSNIKVHGNGTIVRQNREVIGFDKISVSGSGNLVIIQGDNEGLEIETDENLMSYIKTRVNDGKLIIDWNNVSLCPTKTIQYRVQLKNISGIETAGAITIESDSITAKDLGFNMAGCGKIAFKKLTADKLSINTCGSGSSIIESGTCGNLKIQTSGSGDFKGQAFESKNVEIGISGSGHAEVNASESIQYHISGSGSIDYIGSPKIDGSISGSGRIRKL